MDMINGNLFDVISKTLPGTDIKDPESLSKSKKEQFAKDFESVFIEKLLDEMKNTIGDWGLEHDGAFKQMQGLFWMHLARDVSANGGMGLWKDIYQSLETAEKSQSHQKVLDKTL